MDDVTSAQRGFPHAGARPSLTCEQSRYGPEVSASAVTAKKSLRLARGEAYLLRISTPPANHVINSSVLCRVCHLLTLPQVQFHAIFSRPTFYYKQFV